MSFHLALLSPSGAHWLDDRPDLSGQDSTRQHAVDGCPLSCNPPGWGAHPAAPELQATAPTLLALPALGAGRATEHHHVLAECLDAA